MSYSNENLILFLNQCSHYVTRKFCFSKILKILEIFSLIYSQLNSLAKAYSDQIASLAMNQNKVDFLQVP